MNSSNPVKITDTTLRDAHQSLAATRMRLSDMEPIAEAMDKVGFWSLEVWGGATFDVTTRFLAEDPWDRVRTLKKLAPNTPLQMLLRGQNLVGYRNYPDDVVEAFIDKSDKTKKFVSVMIQALYPLKREVSLHEIKQNKDFKDFSLVKQSRLSVMKVDLKYWKKICKMGKV